MRPTLSILVLALCLAGRPVPADENAGCAAKPDFFESARAEYWADWLSRVEHRAALHRSYEKQLNDLKAQHRVLQLEASTSRASDFGNYAGDYSRRVYENIIAQAKLMIERKQALEQPLEKAPAKGSERPASFLVHSFLR